MVYKEVKDPQHLPFPLYGYLLYGDVTCGRPMAGRTKGDYLAPAINPPKPETIFSPTVPLGSWSSNPLGFLRYIFSLLKYGIFRFSVFFNSVRLFMNNYCQFVTVHCYDPPLNSKLL